MSNKKVLIISPIPTHPTVSGNRARVLALAETIRSQGYDVYFLHIEWRKGDEDLMSQYWGDRYSKCNYTAPQNTILKTLKRLYTILGIQAAYRYGLDEWYDHNLDKTILELKSRFNFSAVIVEYVFFSKALDSFGPETRKIIDTHDVFTDRHKHYLNHGQKPTWYSMNRKDESKGLNRADYIIAIQNNEAEYFSKICNKRVVVVGHNIDLKHDHSKHIISTGVLFIASGNTINTQAANFLISSVLPIVRAKLPEVRFNIAGTICKSLPEIEGIVKLGIVDDLGSVYEQAAVVVNPVFIGTGLKIKTIEAMAYGKPLVTTSVGAEGLERYINKAFLVGDTPELFAECIVKLLSDIELSDQLSKAGPKIIDNCNKINIDAINSILT